MDILTDPEFWFFVAPCWALGGWAGWKLAEWEEEGFDEIFRIDVRYRFIILFRSIARL